jgi:hypothetical protein
MDSSSFNRNVPTLLLGMTVLLSSGAHSDEAAEAVEAVDPRVSLDASLWSARCASVRNTVPISPPRSRLGDSSAVNP